MADAAANSIHFSLIRVDANHGVSGIREGNRQRKAHISQAKDGHGGGVVL